MASRNLRCWNALSGEIYPGAALSWRSALPSSHNTFPPNPWAALDYLSRSSASRWPASTALPWATPCAPVSRTWRRPAPTSSRPCRCCARRLRPCCRPVQLPRIATLVALWPNQVGAAAIKGAEKVLPLGLMFFAILFCYTILRDTKDVLVVTATARVRRLFPSSRRTSTSLARSASRCCTRT